MIKMSRTEEDPKERSRGYIHSQQPLGKRPLRPDSPLWDNDN